MAAIPYELKNDSIDTIPFVGSDAANDPVPLDPSTVLTVTNGDAAELSAVMNGNNLVMNCLVWPVAGNPISVIVDDGSGPLNSFEYAVTVVADLTPIAVMPDATAITHAAQPVPGPAVVTPPAGP